MSVLLFNDSRLDIGSRNVTSHSKKRALLFGKVVAGQLVASHMGDHERHTRALPSARRKLTGGFNDLLQVVRSQLKASLSNRTGDSVTALFSCV